MAEKQNCWEFNNCGREPGGSKRSTHGVCPTTGVSFANGLNGGKNGGRVCWTISGTFSKNKAEGRFASHILSCLDCKFFKLVEKEEGIDNFTLLTPVQSYKYESQLCNKREFTRFFIHLDIELLLSGKLKGSIAGVTKNISRDGLSIEIENCYLQTLDTIALRVKHPRQDALYYFYGNVVWERKSGNKCFAGIKLKDIKYENEDEILNYAYDRWIEETIYFQSIKSS